MFYTRPFTCVYISIKYFHTTSTMSLSPNNILRPEMASYVSKKLLMRNHVLRGPQIHNPSCGRGFRCSISHNKCKIILCPCKVCIYLMFASTIMSNVSQLVIIVVPWVVGAPFVVVEPARVAGQHGRIISLRPLFIFLDTLCMRHAMMKSNVSSFIMRVSNGRTMVVGYRAKS